MTEIMFDPDAMMLTHAEFRVLMRMFVNSNAVNSNMTNNDFYNGCLNLLHRVDAYVSACDRYNDSQTNNYVNDELDRLNDPAFDDGNSTTHNVIPHEQWLSEEEPPF